MVYTPTDYTPIQETVCTRDDHQFRVWVKRDDLCELAGVRGGKVRTCWALAKDAKGGLITAGARHSPQINIVAHMAKKLGVPCRAHTPQGKLLAEVQEAVDLGCQIVQHKAGYNSVIVARAEADAKANPNWTYIPFGMECQTAVRQTSGQVVDIPEGVERIVVPVGSGMSFVGVLHGLGDLRAKGRKIPVLGIMVGADPVKRLRRYAPPFWSEYASLKNAGVEYHKEAPEEYLKAIKSVPMLDPVYEGKCVPFLRENDLLWIVGVRNTRG